MSHTIHDHNFSYNVDQHISKETLKTQPKFEKFMAIARDMSETSLFDTYKLGAVIFAKGRLIAKGQNQTKTHPRQKKYNALRGNVSFQSKHYLHAEMDALNKVQGMNLKNAEIMIYRTSNDRQNRQQGLARPCAACMKAIKDAGISVIHYSTPDGFATEYIYPDVAIEVKNARRKI